MSRPRVSRAAVASFVVGIAGVLLFVVAPILALVSIPLGYFALARIRKNPGEIGGRGFAIAGLTLSFVSTQLMILGTAGCSTNTRGGKASSCMINLRQLGVGVMSFSANNRGRLPGVRSQFFDDAKGGKLEVAGATGGVPNLVKPEYAWMADWLAGTSRNLGDRSADNQKERTGFFSQPTRGTLYGYVTTTKAYICTAIEPETVGSGRGSNDQFDYSMLQIVSGARVDRIARTADVKFSSSGGMMLQTPVLVEEDPATINGSGVLDGTWCKSEQLAMRHKNGTNVMTLDGSVYWLLPPDGSGGVRALDVTLKSTATAIRRTGDSDNTPFGWFDSN